MDSALSAALSVAGPSHRPETDPRYPVCRPEKLAIGCTRHGMNTPRLASGNGAVDGQRTQYRLLAVFVSEHIRREQYDSADALNRSLITWVDNLSVPLPVEKRAEILLSRGITDLKRKNFPVARSQFRFIAEGEEFANTRQSIRNLLTAEVDRLTGRADEAQQMLTRMARSG